MGATTRSVYQALQAELVDVRPARRQQRRGHVDEGHPIDLRYDGGFHRPAAQSRFAAAASLAADDDLVGGMFSGQGSWRVESFEDVDPEEAAVIYGAGQLEDEEEPEADDETVASEQPTTTITAARAAFGSASSRSVSFGEEDVPDAPIWGTGELEGAEETSAVESASLSDDVEGPVWGTGELEAAEQEAAAGSDTGAVGAGQATDDARQPGDMAPSTSSGASTLAAATFSRIAANTDDVETAAFANDLQAILAGQKDHPSTHQEAPPIPGSEDTEPAPVYDTRPVSSGFSHSDFDRWGATTRNLATATSYDVGSFDLSRQFDTFDAELDAADRRVGRQAAAMSTVPSPSPRDEFAEDMSALGPTVASSIAPAPAAPAPTRVPSVPRAMSDEIPLDPGTGGMSIDERMLETGDIILSTTPDLTSGVIRLGTDAPVSHSLIYIGGGQVVEAIGPGVVLRSLAEAVDHSNVAVAFRKPDLTAEQALIVRDFIGQQVGKPYTSKVGIVRQAGFQLDRRVFCSGKTGDELDRCINWVGRVNLGTPDNESVLLLGAASSRRSPTPARRSPTRQPTGRPRGTSPSSACTAACRTSVISRRRRWRASRQHVPFVPGGGRWGSTSSSRRSSSGPASPCTRGRRPADGRHRPAHRRPTARRTAAAPRRLRAGRDSGARVAAGRSAPRATGCRASSPRSGSPRGWSAGRPSRR